MLTAVVASPAAALTIGGFNIDGIVPDAGSMAFTDPSGATAELGPLNQNTTKLGVINTDPLPTLGYTSITPGNDLTTAWLQTKVDPATGHVWLYFAFARASASTGVVAFEFEKAAAPADCDYTGVNLTDPPGATNAASQNLIANCNPFKNRSPGDFLLAFDLQGQNLVIVKRTFLGNGLGFDSTNLDATVSAGAFSGTGNQTGIMGEGAVDLTATVFGSNPDKCFSVANVIPMTTTGNSDTADFKDVVLGDLSGTGISSCGSVKVKKATDPAGGTGTFPYMLSRTDGSALRFPDDGGEMSLAGTLTGDGDFDLIGNLKTGTNYTLTEGAVGPVWAMQSIVCVADGTPYTITSGGTFPVKASTISECTITNRKQPGTLTVIKQVVNDNGGTKTPSDFTISLGDSGNTSFPGTVSPGTKKTFEDGYAYNVSESGPTSEYAATYSGDCEGKIEAGVDKTCTITNDDKTAHLKLVKEVTNSSGGTADPTDWTLNATGDKTYSGAGGFDLDVDAGSYALTESEGPAGYEGGFFDCGEKDVVTLQPGESKTCTIVNVDVPAHLKLVKEVINDNGGTAVATDFTLSAAGPTPISGAGGAGSDVSAGTYDLSETALPGYSAGSWSCVGGTQDGASVTLALAQSATCTITNDDIQPKLTVIKTVVNDNGGTKTVADFPLFVGSTSVTSGETNGFDAGTHTVSETQQYGYTASAWGGDCAADGKISLKVGDNRTCTITNDDQPGTIVIVKNAKPQNGTFTFATTGASNGLGTSWPASFTLNGDTTGDGNTQTFTVDAGAYSVKESTQLGWLLTGIGGSTDPNTPYNCVVTGTGGSSGFGDLATMTADITLKNGDTVTCSFDNTGQGVTRTQGFWATHTKLAEPAWFGGTSYTYPSHTFPGVATTPGIGDRLMCGRDIDTLGKLMGGFWGDIAKKSNSGKRTSLDQTRMQLLQQLLAAELNASAFGAVPSGGTGMFAQWESALCGTSTTAIKNAMQQAALFNTAGDSGTFTPGTSADSKYARSVADIPFWDIIKP
jgi:hypothetical protein